MTVATVIAGIANTGDVESSNNASSYATALAGGSIAVRLASSDAGVVQVGQYFNGVTAYYIWEALLDFDTSVVPSGAAISSAVLAIQGPVWGNESTTDFVVQARLYDFGATITTADYVAGSGLIARTLLAHLTSAGWPVDTYTDMVDDDLAANIVAGGTTRIMLCSENTRLGVAPTTNEDLFITAYDAVKGCKLTITYTTPTGQRQPAIIRTQAVHRASSW